MRHFFKMNRPHVIFDENCNPDNTYSLIVCCQGAVELACFQLDNPTVIPTDYQVHGVSELKDDGTYDIVWSVDLTASRHTEEAVVAKIHGLELAAM